MSRSGQTTGESEIPRWRPPGGQPRQEKLPEKPPDVIVSGHDLLFVIRFLRTVMGYDWHEGRFDQDAAEAALGKEGLTPSKGSRDMMNWYIEDLYNLLYGIEQTMQRGSDLLQRGREINIWDHISPVMIWSAEDGPDEDQGEHYRLIRAIADGKITEEQVRARKSWGY